MSSGVQFSKKMWIFFSYFQIKIGICLHHDNRTNIWSLKAEVQQLNKQK